MRRHRSSTLRGLGLATPLAKTKPVDGPLYLGYHAGPLKATCRWSSLHEAAFRVGVKAAGCILGDRLDRA